MQSSSMTRSVGLTDTATYREAYHLKLIQEPEEGRAAGRTEKARGTKWPIDPPPVIEFVVNDQDKSRAYLHSPFWFCTAELEASMSHRSTPPSQANLLSGCLVSSLHKVKLSDNKEHGLFIFGDLNAKLVGHYRLKFTLYEMRQGAKGWHAAQLNAITSQSFKVLSSKEHQTAPPRESTSLSRTLSEAGVKLRIRKESTKRKAQASEWAADKRQAVSTMLPPPTGSMGTGSMGPPSRSGWSNYNYPNYSINISHDLTFEKPPRPAMGTPDLGIRNYMDNEPIPIPRTSSILSTSQTSAAYQNSRLPNLNSDNLSHSRVQSSGSDSMASQFGHLSYGSQYRAPQRLEHHSQLSPEEPSPSYETNRSSLASQQYFAGRPAEQPDTSRGGYIPSQTTPTLYRSIETDQYNSSRLTSTANGNGTYAAPATDLSLGRGYPDADTNDYRQPGGHFANTAQADPKPDLSRYLGTRYTLQQPQLSANFAFQGANGQVGPDRLTAYQYPLDQPSLIGRPSYNPTQQFAYSRT